VAVWTQHTTPSHLLTPPHTSHKSHLTFHIKSPFRFYVPKSHKKNKIDTKKPLNLIAKITMSSTQEQTFATILATLTPQQQKIMLETLKKPKKITQAKKQTPNSLFKENCHEEFEEPVIEGWSQVEAPYGGVYASGAVLTKKTRAEFSNARCFAHMVDKMPKRHFLTLETAVEFAELLDGECQAITKTTAGYELRAFRCAIKNTPSGFNSGLRTWLRDSPFEGDGTYASLSTTQDAHTLVRTPVQAKKIHFHNEKAVEEYVDIQAEEEEESVDIDPEDTDTEEEEIPQAIDEEEEERQEAITQAFEEAEKVEAEEEADDEDRDIFSVGGFSLTNPDMELDWDFIDSLEENGVELTELEEKIIRLHIGAGSFGPRELWACVESDAVELDTETTEFIIQMYQDIQKDEKFCRIYSPADEEVVRINVEEDMESYMIRQF